MTRGHAFQRYRAAYCSRFQADTRRPPMNFDFNDDQKFLKSEARKFLDAECPTTRVRAVLDDAGKAYDEALWQAVAAQGWLGAAIPEEHGGLGLGHLELCVIAEELGRVAAPIPFASTVYLLAEAVML